MRICILGNASSIHIVRWANGLKSLGNDVFVISADSPGIHHLDPEIEVTILRFRPKWGYYLNFLEARMIINKIKPDLLNTHYASGYGTLSRLIGYKPTLLSVWGSDVFDVPYQSRLKFFLVRKNLKAADRIASTSMAMRYQIEKIYRPLNEILITPFGVDTDLFKPYPEKYHDHITIGIIKGIEEKYGHVYLIKAVKVVIDKLLMDGFADIAKKIRLLIVGDGPQIGSLKKIVSDLNLSHLTEFTGQVQHKVIPDILNRIDICCYPSIVKESFGVSVVEASACQIPVVVSNIGGLPEVVKDGETGFLVKPRSEFELAEKIYYLIKNPNIMERMGKNGRKFVSQYYDWQENIRRMEKYLKEVIEEYKRA